MSPAILQLIIFSVEEAIKEAPLLADDLKQLFASSTPTAADFAALRAKVAGESYAKFVPESNLP